MLKRVVGLILCDLCSFVGDTAAFGTFNLFACQHFITRGQRHSWSQDDGEVGMSQEHISVSTTTRSFHAPRCEFYARISKHHVPLAVRIIDMDFNKDKSQCPWFGTANRVWFSDKSNLQSDATL